MKDFVKTTILSCLITTKYIPVLAAFALTLIFMPGTRALAEQKGQGYIFNVPPQTLESALIDYTEQSGVQLVMQTDTVKGLESRGISGYLDRKEAMEKLLTGTDLEYDFTSDNTVVVRKKKSIPFENNESYLSDQEPKNIILAQNETREAAIGGTVTRSGTGLSESRQSENGLEEIIVTAQKREQDIQDIGLAVTAFTRNQIHALALFTTDQIAQQTPGLLFTQTAGSQATGMPSIRGVSQNDTNIHHELPNAVYIDGAYQSLATAVLDEMYDLERIEVLRGPQGTLFGRNATGGLIHYITRKPTEEFEAYGDLAIAEYEQIRFEGAVSGPLSERLLGRLSIGTNYNGTFIDNRGGEDLGEHKSYNGRGQLLFRASDRTEFLVSIYGGTVDDPNLGGYQHDSAVFGEDGLERNVAPDENAHGTCPGCDAFGYQDTDGDVHATDINTIGFLERETFGVTGKLTQSFDRFTLTSITHYQNLEFDYLEDSDISPNDIFGVVLGQTGDEFSQELRLNGETERTRWTAGFYYLSIDTDNHVTVDLPVFGVALDGTWRMDTNSWAVFGQAEYDFAPQWTIIGGFRWTEDKVEIDLESMLNVPGVGTFPNFQFNKSTVGDLAELDSGDYSAKLEIDWHPNDDWLLYASVTRGLKGGGFSAPVNPQPADTIGFDPEVLTSYEGGFKSTLFNGTTRLNASIYYYDYIDYQAFTRKEPDFLRIMFNADAEIYGFEAELVTQPAEGWAFVFGINLLEAKVFDVTLPSGRVVDRVPPQAPSITLNGLARKQWPAWKGGAAAAQLDFNYVADYQANQNNAPATQIPEYVIGNARLSYTNANDQWEVAVFVKNLADADIQTYAFAGGGFGLTQKVYLPPRWIGGQISYRWP